MCSFLPSKWVASLFSLAPAPKIGSLGLLPSKQTQTSVSQNLAGLMSHKKSGLLGVFPTQQAVSWRPSCGWLSSFPRLQPQNGGLFSGLMFHQQNFGVPTEQGLGLFPAPQKMRFPAHLPPPPPPHVVGPGPGGRPWRWSRVDGGHGARRFKRNLPPERTPSSLRGGLSPFFVCFLLVSWIFFLLHP